MAVQPVPRLLEIFQSPSSSPRQTGGPPRQSALSNEKTDVAGQMSHKQDNHSVLASHANTMLALSPCS